jgi:hypothetical protein
MKKRAPRHPLAAAVLTVATLTLLAAGLAACGPGAGSGAGGTGVPAPSATASPIVGSQGGTPMAGTKMAPGLYDLEDGTVVAVGTVEHRDLEGGFWAVIGDAQAEGDEGEVVAVVANGDRYAEQFRQNEGLSFLVYGRRAGDASIRMAGPEITATRVVLAADAGPAE